MNRVRVMYGKSGCKMCVESMRAIYLVNQYITNRIVVRYLDKYAVNQEVADDLSRIYNREMVRTPTIRIGKRAYVPVGFPVWEELFGELSRIIGGDRR